MGPQNYSLNTVFKNISQIVNYGIAMLKNHEHEFRYSNQQHSLSQGHASQKIFDFQHYDSKNPSSFLKSFLKNELFNKKFAAKFHLKALTF
jgi:hypothetical protein